jgi:TetR/AcrR family transcriptional repressor of nem operon
MRISREQSAENRARILAAAERLFRERGIDSVSISDVMSEAGFTHGGFYNHFDSKEDLVAVACAQALGASREPLEKALGSSKSKAWLAYARQYLSAEHRDHPETGCTLGALAADAGRQNEAVQTAFAEHIEAIVAQLRDHLAETTPAEASPRLRERAIRTWSELVGAVVLARAIAAADRALSNEILAASRKAIQERSNGAA